jgi:hypothetical protein
MYLATLMTLSRAMVAFFGAVTVFWIAAGILGACRPLVHKSG